MEIGVQEYHSVKLQREKYLLSDFHVLTQHSQSLSRSQLQCRCLEVLSSLSLSQVQKSIVHFTLVSYAVWTFCKMSVP